VTVQVAYSIIDRRPGKKAVAWCLKHNVKILAYGSLLGGFLSEKYLGSPEPQRFELTTQSLSKYKSTIDQWGGWILFQELLLVLSQIADKYKVSISNVAVRYIADKPAVAAVIIGARLSIAEHIPSNQATFSFPGFYQGDIALLHAVVEKGNGIAGDCGDEYR
jgi:aryl-alcohol dehydrogenase-like predicted oxidoreductase